MAVLKTEGGDKYPAGAYAYTPDTGKPFGWKLRLWQSPTLKETARQVGLAIAALGKGFRGEKVQIPPADLAAVKAKVRAAWKRVNPKKDVKEMPPAIKESVEVGELLTEFIDHRGVTLQVDRDKSVIEGVKLLGLRSANGREYPKETIVRATALYEGARVNVDHPEVTTKPRNYRDRIGTIHNPHFDGQRNTGGLFGDFHFNPKHPLADQMLWDAENAPENLGFSHNVQARTGRHKGQVIVEEILKVQSVDLVADPATTRGLFESSHESEEEIHEMDVSELTIEMLQEQRPDLVTVIREAVETKAVEAKQLQEAEAKLTAANKQLTDKAVGLEKENETLKASAALAAHKSEVDALLGEAKLPDAAMSDGFRKQLDGVADLAAAKVLVGDRQKLVESFKQGPKSTEQGQTGTTPKTSADFVSAIT